jgi:hypothetical protein
LVASHTPSGSWRTITVIVAALPVGRLATFEAMLVLPNADPIRE